MNKLVVIFFAIPLYPMFWLYCGLIGWCVLGRLPKARDVSEVLNQAIGQYWRGER